MKKSILILATISMMLIVSCKENKQENTEKTIEKTVIVEKKAEEPIVKDSIVEESNGTTVNVNKDGVEISSKDNSKKTEVNIGTDGASISIKK